MKPEERDAAYHTLITCDGKGKEAKAEALRKLIAAAQDDAVRISGEQFAAEWDRILTP